MIVAKDRFRNSGFALNSVSHCATRPPRKTTGDAVRFGQERQCKTRSFFWRAGAPTRLFLFHHALQGMLMLACEIHHLRHLGLGNLIGEHAAFPDSMMMDVEHDLGRSL